MVLAWGNEGGKVPSLAWGSGRLGGFLPWEEARKGLPGRAKQGCMAGGAGARGYLGPPRGVGGAVGACRDSEAAGELGSWCRLQPLWFLVGP